MPVIDVIIPAHNEELSIGKVIDDIPDDLVHEIIVVNNNSSDRTADVALNKGAVVLHEKNKGYGYACLRGMVYLYDRTIKCDIAVFMDGDYADYPYEIIDVVDPIIKKDFDMVIGSRALGAKEKGAMTIQQQFGNWLASQMIRLLYSYKYTDLGPFRAIKFQKLMSLGMKDKTYGWTVEMQVKAVRQKLSICEVPVNYKRRIGFSKVSGTLKGSILAGYRIILTIIKYM